MFGKKNRYGIATKKPASGYLRSRRAYKVKTLNVSLDLFMITLTPEFDIVDIWHFSSTYTREDAYVFPLLVSSCLKNGFKKIYRI